MTAEQTTPLEGLDAAQLLSTLLAFKKGDFSARMPADRLGLAGKICDTLNEIFELGEQMRDEFARIGSVVGKEGKITQRASLRNGRGGWAACIDSVNGLISDFVQPSTEIARVIGAVAKGDLGQSMPLMVEGRPLQCEFLQYRSRGGHHDPCWDCNFYAAGYRQ